MIGHAPFLGQVRLAGPRLAQMAGRLAVQVLNQQRVPVPGVTVMVVFQSTEFVSGVTDARGFYLVPVSNDRAGAARIRIVGLPPGYTIDGDEKTEDLYADALVEIPFVVKAPAAAADVAPDREVPDVPDSSPWIWIAGGLAAVGLVAYAATR